MKIVVLDGYTLNPGDLDGSALQSLGDVTIHDRTPADKVLERAQMAEILVTNKTVLNASHIQQLPQLKYIGVLATGYNVVDVEAAKQKSIPVTNVPGYSSASVAQLTFALILELCHHVQKHSDSVREGKWSQSKDFCFWDYPLIELAGKTIGIIGMGDIGSQVADISTAFGMNIIGASRTQKGQTHRTNFRWASIEGLLDQSDIVSLHTPLVAETKGLINRSNLQRMKRSAFLINTSRGPLVMDKDLADALNTGVIAGAGIDVLSMEPPSADNPLLSAKNCIITPHIAWATKEARTRLMDVAVKNIAAFLEGKPVNVVNA
ncbi:D-2-hydroxyacid dehydrogenase [Flavisolibacter tropicus]|uniref:Glycerate dehydrogenase n=1 Tax=Flavisolibacter tropicus TaxID=1492898 RepID=A0A172TVE8_9BACT|nr:D-2-hydroxyacid dehydrogenase [Flavisolibacter tropicus]ANE51055.1 glycerate dehydrogenase [Flavisolibacter tropicus]